MKSLRRLVSARDEVHPEHAHNLCMFLSRHALLLRKCADLGDSDCWRVNSLLDYARARPFGCPQRTAWRYSSFASMRRFFWRPSSVPLGAMGRASPKPTASSRFLSIPFDTM